MRLCIEPPAQNAIVRIGLHKQLCRELVFGSGALQQIEFKGGRGSCGNLAEPLFENYLAKQKPQASRARPQRCAPGRAKRPTDSRIENGRACSAIIFPA